MTTPTDTIDTALSDLAVTAPPTLRPNVLAEVGLADRFARMASPIGPLVVAWNEEQLAKLPAIVAQAHKNGVADVTQISAAELRRREPQLAPHALGAVLVTMVEARNCPGSGQPLRWNPRSNPERFVTWPRP